jgi:hypothetical protein
VIAFENKAGKDTIGRRLQDAGLVPAPEGMSTVPEDSGHTPQPPLDLVCMLGQGVYIDVRPQIRWA